MKIVLNADKEKVAKIREALKANGGYCPCMPLKNENTKCMCKNFLEEVEEGLCHCGLYCKIKEN